MAICKILDGSNRDFRWLYLRHWMAEFRIQDFGWLHSGFRTAILGAWNRSS